MRNLRFFKMPDIWDYGGLDVEGILAAVYQSVFGGDVYLSLEEKVANLLFNEIGNSQVV